MVAEMFLKYVLSVETMSLDGKKQLKIYTALGRPDFRRPYMHVHFCVPLARYDTDRYCTVVRPRYSIDLD